MRRRREGRDGSEIVEDREEFGDLFQRAYRRGRSRLVNALVQVEPDEGRSDGAGRAAQVEEVAHRRGSEDPDQDAFDLVGPQREPVGARLGEVGGGLPAREELGQDGEVGAFVRPDGPAEREQPPEVADCLEALPVSRDELPRPVRARRREQPADAPEVVEHQRLVDARRRRDIPRRRPGDPPVPQRVERPPHQPDLGPRHPHPPL